jgi:homoserine kinase type II
MAILTPISDSELAAFFAGYRLGALRSARGVEAGTVNTSYAVELEAGRFFVRIYEEQDAAGAAREAKVLGHLARSAVPTPAPVAAADGAATGTLGGKPAAVFPWVDGEMLCQRAVTAEAAEAVGAALARIHLAGHAPDAPLDAGRFGPEALVERCARVRTSSDPDARGMAASLEQAAREVARTRRRDVPHGLVHGDLFRDNVLWSFSPRSPRSTPAPIHANGEPCKIAALLDFESAHDGPFAYDLAVTILSWSFTTTLEATIARAIVRGYRTVRELEPATRDALYDEALFAALRFTITRITDDAIRVGKRWQRFVARRDAVAALGRNGFAEVLGL